MNCCMRSYNDTFSKLFEKSENLFSSKYFSSKSQSDYVEFSVEQNNLFSVGLHKNI